MYTSGSDVFTSLVETNGVTSDDYGLTAIPTEGADAGVLVGGTLAAVNVKADDATKAAAIKWIDFFYLSKLLDQEQAVADAQVRFDNGQPVGTPVLPIFSRDQYELSLEWVADFINVPLDQMTGYTSVMFDQQPASDPSRSTHETYGALDVMIQAVLSYQNADIDALVQQCLDRCVALLDEGVDVGVLIRQHGLDHHVQRAVGLLRRTAGLTHDRLVEHHARVPGHLVERDVDEVRDPLQGQLVLVAAEDRQDRGADGLAVVEAYLRVGHGLLLVEELAQIEEVDPLDRRGLRRVVGLDVDRGKRATHEDPGVGALGRDGGQAVVVTGHAVGLDERGEDVRAGRVHRGLAGRERLVDRASVERGVGEERVVLPAQVVQELQGGPRAVVVQRRGVGAVAVVLLDPAAARVGRRGQLPATGVVRGHRRVARDARRVLDGLRVLADLVPRRRRVVRVESGLGEQRAVVVQCDAVDGLGRDRVDLPVLAHAGLQQRLVEVGRVRQRLELRVDVGQLAVLDERLGVGERDLVDVGQRSTGELGGEGRRAPLVLDGLDGDVRVHLLELGDALVERVEGGLLGARDEADHAQRDLLVLGASRSLSVRAGGIGTATGQQADHEGTGENQYRDGTWGPHRHSFLAGGAGWWWVSAVRRD